MEGFKVVKFGVSYWVAGEDKPATFEMEGYAKGGLVVHHLLRWDGEKKPEDDPRGGWQVSHLRSGKLVSGISFPTLLEGQKFVLTLLEKMDWDREEELVLVEGRKCRMAEWIAEGRERECP